MKTHDIAWLARRVGFGLSVGQFEEHREIPLKKRIKQLLFPARNGIPESPDPWSDLVLNPGEPGPYMALASFRWIKNMAASERPLEEWMTFFWHDHFALSARSVKPPSLAVDHVRLLRKHALGNYRKLLRAVTVDPGMLVFLDGAESTGDSPNENFGRELLELYALGVGNYTEDDVKAAARALSGWTVKPFEGTASFKNRLHDNTPQTFLGVSGVKNVSTVIDAVTNHPACARFVATKLIRAILGDVKRATVNELVKVFADNDLEVRPLLEAIILKGIEGEYKPVVNPPVHWYVEIKRASEATGLAGTLVASTLRAMGQVPLLPPNVGGFPKGEDYLASSAVSGRFVLAAEVASRTRNTALLAASRDRDWKAVARALNRPEGFSKSTRDALDKAAQAESPTALVGSAALAIAFASPDMMIQ